jgi:hypothetical protein
VAAGHDLLQKGFFTAVFDQGVTRLGDAITEGKEYLWEHGSGLYRDLIDTYVLLGDPALQISFSEPTGVRLASFTAEAGPVPSVILRWETTSEIQSLGFNVYRAATAGGTRVRLNEALLTSQTPPGSPMGARYEYVDEGGVIGGSYFYWLEEVGTRGGSTFYGPVEASVPSISPSVYTVFMPIVHRQR